MLDLNLPPTHKSGLDLVGFERSVSSVDMNDSKDEFQVVSSFLAFPSFPTFCRFVGYLQRGLSALARHLRLEIFFSIVSGYLRAGYPLTLLTTQTAQTSHHDHHDTSFAVCNLKTFCFRKQN